MRRVWVPVQGELKYQKAKRFGELEVIFSNRVMPTRYEQLIWELNLALESFNFLTDHILISGSIIDSLAVGLIAAKEGEVHVLVWDAELQDFLSLEII